MQFQYRPCETTRITSRYAYRIDPITKKKATFHPGLDISPIDKVKFFQEPIFACLGGKVLLSSFNSARGNQVLIDHGSNIMTRSQHLADCKVSKGDNVAAGQIIGHMGNTGYSTAQHLHFEVIADGKTVNPEPYIKDLPIPSKHSNNFKKVKEKYGFEANTMSYLENYKYAEFLFERMLLPVKEQHFQLGTINYILGYKYGKEIFEKLNV
ncbi:M23 family metallopeptidase [Anaerovorax odorimutans]|uniref:M23 family metallopeptidase n=1 Tax=Anaerovorax odorimutans TaxID=109327 RepID=UPI00041F3CCD|nr:M23 family metallopeptidase [Anaerovorax odorimutans]